MPVPLIRDLSGGRKPDGARSPSPPPTRPSGVSSEADAGAP